MAQTNKRQKSVVFFSAAGLLVLVLVVLAVRKPPPAVPVVSLSRADLSQTITSNGKVVPIDPTIARAEFPSFVSKVAAVEGQAVRRGQLILTLDASDIKAQLSQARGDLIAAQTQLGYARAGGSPADVAQLTSDLEQSNVEVANLERTQKALAGLLAKQAATQDEVAQNDAALAKAKARLQSLQQRKDAMQAQSGADVERAQLRVGQDQDQISALEEKVRSATVTAPAGGTLYSLPVREGDYVKIGDELADMADLHKVEVLVYVDEPDMGWLSPQQTVQVTWEALPGRMWTGSTEQTPKQVVPHGMRSVAELLCSVDNGKLELLPNTNVAVKILVRERKNALAVPRGAVREVEGVHYVFVFDGDKVRRRNIALGVASASDYEVLSGLTDKDSVALPGERTLRDGMSIRVAEAN
jgi:HlyD family secretion protein